MAVHWFTTLPLSAYLQAYLAAGALVCLAMLGQYLRTRGARRLQRSVFLEALHPERKTLRYRLVNHFLVPGLGVLAILLLWPIGLFFAFQVWAEARTQAKAAEKSVFTVQRRDLTHPESITEIEQSERVCDPLCAAPDLPFGHLHGAWTAFLKNLETGDTLWRFSVRWTSPHANQEIRSGLAILRNGKVGPWLLTSRKPVH